MKTEIGEYVVGAYLALIEKCDFVTYNVRPPEQGLKGLAEFDVIGIRFEDGKVFLCEVTTHLDGLNYGTYNKTINKIQEKLARQKNYYDTYLWGFPEAELMFWSPTVPKGKLTDVLERMKDITLVINESYSSRIRELKQVAKATTRDYNNPFFRSLQVLEHIK
jgi:hypothetical protein